MDVIYVWIIYVLIINNCIRKNEYFKICNANFIQYYWKNTKIFSTKLTIIPIWKVCDSEKRKASYKFWNFRAPKEDRSAKLTSHGSGLFEYIISSELVSKRSTPIFISEWSRKNPKRAKKRTGLSYKLPGRF